MAARAFRAACRKIEDRPVLEQRGHNVTEYKGAVQWLKEQ